MFDDIGGIFEALVDWPKRLANEAPFFRRWFQEASVQRVLDVACGTGQHAAMFHEWGLRVEGADISPGMIDRAKKLFDAPAGLRWVVRAFETPIAPAEPFDAAICVGNSIALAPDRATAVRAVRQMFAAVRDGGLMVIQVLNLWSLPDGPCVWQKCKRVVLQHGEAMILRGIHRCGARGYVEFAVVELSDPLPLRAESVPLLGIEAADLEQMARDAGASETRFFGDYHDQAYDRGQSADLILVARR